MPLLKDRRASTRARLVEGIYDLIIVGAGINGAAIARDAALRGYRVALIEQGDLAHGTSSRSSRLIHGGLRYLEQGEVGLIFESVSERHLLSRLARHLVRPLPFIVPVYREETFPLFAVNIGLWIYDALALFRNYATHTKLSAAQLAERVPAIRREGLRGGVRYYDYQTDDARLVLENALGAQAAGAELLTYCRVEDLVYHHKRVAGVRVKDLLSGEAFDIRGRAIIVAAGPWTDEILDMTPHARPWLRPSKGVHVVLPCAKLPLDDALTMRHPKDDRVLFVLPYHERVVVGTTDTDLDPRRDRDLNRPEATPEDVRYLLAAARHAFPSLSLEPSDVLATWTGIRPLLSEEDAANPSDISREHRIEVRRDGVIVIAGGKFTTYRKMAAECLDRAATTIGLAGGTPHLRRCQTKQLPLPGSVGLTSERAFTDLERELGDAFGGDRAIGAHLATTYGIRGRNVARLAHATPGFKERIDAELPYVWAEIAHAAHSEEISTLEDVMVRRTQLFYRAFDQSLATAGHAADIIGNALGWNDRERQTQVTAYEAKIAANNAWRGHRRR